MSRFFFWSLVVALPSGCGGGGGGGTPGPGAGGAQAQADALEVLESCVVADLQDLLFLTDLASGWVTDPAGAPQPELDLVGAVVSGGLVPWTLDLDADGVADLRGDLAFLDADGGVFLPVTVDDVLAGRVASVEDVLARLGDGESVRLTWDLLGLPGADAAIGAGEGALRLFWSGGAPGALEGDARVESGECTLDLEYESDAATATGTGGYPVAQGTFAFESGGRTGTGSFALDGSARATVRLALDGDTERTWTVDLPTGRVVG